MLIEKIKKLFIPHKGNNFKPNFLERASMGVMLLLVLLSFAMANIQSMVWIDSDRMVSTILPAVIVDMTNQERDGGSLGKLVRSDVLDAAAKLKAEDMAKNEYFAHYSPTGISPWYWFDAVSYNFVHAGENLAVYFTDSSDVVDAWMESPTHRANIMDGKFTHIGVGTAKGKYKGISTIFVVQLFGTPSAQVNSKVSEETKPQIIAQNSNVLGESVQIADDTSVDVVASSHIVDDAQNAEVHATAPAVSESDITTEEITPKVEREPAKTFDNTSVLYSDLATTSRAGVPATIDTQNAGSSSSGTTISSLEKSITQPHIWLQALYSILAVIVVIALLFSIIIEWRKQNPLQIAYAGGLLAMMAFLIHIHTLLTAGALIV